MEISYKHYITADDAGRITDGWSDGLHPDRNTTGAICINERGGYQFRLVPVGVENPALFYLDTDIPLYHWDGEKVIRITHEEVQELLDTREDKPEPTWQDRLEAQTFYTAMMTDTLLEV